MRRDVFQAIADPTRREILGLLTHDSLHLNAVAEHFEISRPAISRHIRILTECGLVTIQQKGRERYVHPNFDKLTEVQDWISHYSQFWNKKLNALEEFLKQDMPGKKNQI